MTITAVCCSSVSTSRSDRIPPIASLTAFLFAPHSDVVSVDRAHAQRTAQVRNASQHLFDCNCNGLRAVSDKRWDAPHVEARYASGHQACELRSAVSCSRLASTAAAVTYDRDDTSDTATRCREALPNAAECPEKLPRETLSLRAVPVLVDIYWRLPVVERPASSH
jgi:hypothetical protein